MEPDHRLVVRRGLPLRPVAESDAEAARPARRASSIGDEDAEGNVLRSHVVEIEKDDDGELVGRYVPADEDTEGYGRGGANF